MNAKAQFPLVTDSVDFGRLNAKGEHLFAVKAGADVKDAMDTLSVMLSVCHGMQNLLCQHMESPDPESGTVELSYGIHYLLEQAGALTEAINCALPAEVADG